MPFYRVDVSWRAGASVYVTAATEQDAKQSVIDGEHDSFENYWDEYSDRGDFNVDDAEFIEDDDDNDEPNAKLTPLVLEL